MEGGKGCVQRDWFNGMFILEISMSHPFPHSVLAGRNHSRVLDCLGQQLWFFLVLKEHGSGRVSVLKDHGSQGPPPPRDCGADGLCSHEFGPRVADPHYCSHRNRPLRARHYCFRRPTRWAVIQVGFFNIGILCPSWKAYP